MDAVAPSFFSWQGANGMGRNSALKILCFFFFCVDIYRLPCLIRSSTLRQSDFYPHQIWGLKIGAPNSHGLSTSFLSIQVKILDKLP